MQFGGLQCMQCDRHWGPNSWFYQNLGQPARVIVENAYRLRGCTPAEMSEAQECLSAALGVFALKIGADKSQVVHALLTGSIESLLAALGRQPGAKFSIEGIREAWTDSFREVILAS